MSQALSPVLPRLARAVVTLVGITVITFLLIRLLPGDPALFQLAVDGRPVPRQAYERMLEDWCWNCPLPEQYLRWLGGLLRGDLGESLADGRPVAARLAERLPPTLLLNALALLLVFGIAVPAGAFLAQRRGGIADRTSRWVAFGLFSLPAFWVAGLLQALFAIRLGWLPMQGMGSPGLATAPAALRLGDLARHVVLPVTCLAYGQLAFLTRFTRANVLESLGSEFVRAARARGLGERAVLRRHALRNACIPLLTLSGLTLPALLAGSVIIESIFSWPGLGRLFYDSILQRDYPVVLALTFLAAVLTLAGNVTADLLYRWADPRAAEAAA